MTNIYITVFWIVLLIVLLIIELSTLGLTTIWFAGGALVAAVVSALGAPLWLSIALFVVVSAVLLFFTRPIVAKYFNKGITKTNVESIVGARAVVTEEINNLTGKGQVKVDGKEWTARSALEDEIIPVNTTVTVNEVSGVKLIVSKGE